VEKATANKHQQFTVIQIKRNKTFMQRLCPLSLVAKAGFNFYLTYLYGKQHILLVDREPYSIFGSFLHRATIGLFD
jgi:hypothetical protein